MGKGTGARDRVHLDKLAHGGYGEAAVVAALTKACIATSIVHVGGDVMVAAGWVVVWTEQGRGGEVISPPALPGGCPLSPEVEFGLL